MNEYPLIGVIIPVYNVERYLNRCIDSVCSQTYRQLEIWLVDDGSTDSSGSICDEYSKNDNRIHVIHKKNGGLSDARNAALNIINAEYITFIDSDDWVSPHYIEHLYNMMAEDMSDLATSWFVEVYDDQHNVRSNKEITNHLVLSRHDFLKKLLYQDGVETSAWGKMYSKKAISNLRYPINKLYEDVPVTVGSVFNSEKISVCSNVDYFYYQRIDSIQNTDFNPHKIDGLHNVQNAVEEIAKRYPDLEKAGKSRIISIACNLLFQIGEGEYSEIREELWNSIIASRTTVIFDYKARKKARLAAVASFLGIKKMKAIYKLTQTRGKRFS